LNDCATDVTEADKTTQPMRRSQRVFVKVAAAFSV
jgi:hypothetical protein